MTVNSRMRRRLRSESGAELIEFSLTLPLLLLIVLGIIEFGFVFREVEIVTNAAREGARIAILDAYDDDDVTARVEQYLTTAGLDLDNVTEIDPGTGTPVPLDSGACISMVEVFVEYDHAVPFIAGIASYFGSTIGNIPIRGRSAMRTEVAAGACAAPEE
jgi:hypothetical protein